jgi:hypothetical protein
MLYWRFSLRICSLEASIHKLSNISDEVLNHNDSPIHSNFLDDKALRFWSY